ncbi:MAG: serine/threonine protein kinase [Deltaproteobacteria bacterium]|nr:serine/threonine protein kinase [Deltaproteobacteria bacterium]
METPPQTIEFGSYRLHDRIGAGGMAEIFLATQPGVQERELVIKRILPQLSGDAQFVKMFVEEARLCAHLKHPNIVQVYDLGEIEAQYFIAMEYVQGRDLLKTLAACARKRIAFPTDIALYIVMEVLKALDYAHNLKGRDGQPMGIIHRDVSPSNVLLSFDGKVKLGDFGIAKASIRERTATGILKGKFGYMAPEQVTGRAIDHRADVFAVGIILYELLTGHRLFAGRNDLQVLERVRDAVIDPPPRQYRADLSPELEAIVLRALSRQAKDRFQTTAELHQALHDYTFRKGVVLSPRMLARFLNDLFVSDETQEQYIAPARSPVAVAANGTPSLLGNAVVTGPDRDVGGAPPAANGKGVHRVPTSNERLASAGKVASIKSRVPLSLIDASAKELGDNFYDESTDSPDPFSEESTRDSTAGEAILPFPGMDPRLQSSFDAGSTVESIEGEDLDEATQQTDVKDFPRRSGVAADPAEPGRRGVSVRRAPLEATTPAEEARALRKSRDENAETEFDLEEQKKSEKRTETSEIEPVSSLTPYGGVPLQDAGLARVIEKPAARQPSSSPGSSARAALRRALDAIEPLESPDDAAGATDLVDSGVHQAELAALEGEPEEAREEDLIEVPSLDASGLTGTEEVSQEDLKGASVATDPSKTAATDVEDQPAEWVESTRDERTMDRQALVAPPIPAANPASAVMSQGAALPVEEPDGYAEESRLSASSLLAESAVVRMSHVMPPEPSDATSPEQHGQDVLDAATTTASMQQEPVLSAMASEPIGAEPSEPGNIPSSVAKEWRAIVQEHSARLGGAGAEPDTKPHDPEDEPTHRGKSPAAAAEAPARPASGRPASVASSARRRVATRAPLAVINPSTGVPDEATRMGVLAPPASPAPEVHARGEASRPASLLGRLDTAPPEAVTKPTGSSAAVLTARPSRRVSSGITAALSEAAAVDEEIRVIRELSRTDAKPHDEHTASGAMLARGVSEAERGIELDELSGPTDPEAGGRAAIAKAAGTARAGPQGAPMFEDSVDTMNSRSGETEREKNVAADVGRLEDEGASDLFGALNLLDSGRLDLEMRSFAPSEEESMETTGVDAREFHGKNRAIAAPSTAGSSNGIEESGNYDARDPAEEQSGISLNFDPNEELTDSISEEDAAVAKSPSARPRSVLIFEEDEDDRTTGGTMAPDIVAERRASSAARDVRAPSRHGSSDLETPLASGIFGESDPNLAHLDTRAVDLSGEDSIPGPARRISSSGFDLGLDGPPPRGSTPPPRQARVSSSPANGTSAAAERRLRAVVERNRPVKELKRGSVAPAAPSPSTPPPPVLQPTATNFAQVTEPPPPVRAALTPFGPRGARGPVPTNMPPRVSVEISAGPLLTTRRAMMILVVVTAIALAAVVMINVLGMKRGAAPKPIAPVSDPATPPPRTPDPTPPAEVKRDVQRAALPEAPALVAPPRSTEASAPPTREASAPPTREAPAPPPKEAPAPPPKEAPAPPQAPKQAASAAPKAAAPKDTPASPPRPKLASPPPEPAKKPAPKPAARPERTKEAASARQEKAPAPKPRAAPPAAAPTTTADPKKRPTKKTPGVEIACTQPVQVIVRPGGTWSDVTRKFIPLQPGDYQLILKPAGGKPQAHAIRVLPEQQNVVRCTE